MLTGNEWAAIIVGLELGMTPEESLRRVAVVPSPSVQLTSSGWSLIRRAEQADRARRIPKVLRRPNLAART